MKIYLYSLNENDSLVIKEVESKYNNIALFSNKLFNDGNFVNCARCGKRLDYRDFVYPSSILCNIVGNHYTVCTHCKDKEIREIEIIEEQLKTKAIYQNVLNKILQSDKDIQLPKNDFIKQLMNKIKNKDKLTEDFKELIMNIQNQLLGE
jgi:hypothetical protein